MGARLHLEEEIVDEIDDLAQTSSESFDRIAFAERAVALVRPPGTTVAICQGARRVRIALQGHQPFAAAVKAIHDTLRALRDGTPPGKLTGIADAELMKRVTRDADYTRWTKDFLGG